VEVMTPTMQWIGKTLPLWHGITAIQDPWLGFGWSWSALAITATFAVAAGALAILAFRRLG
jgi:ABC-2 type transport system permease protein